METYHIKIEKDHESEWLVVQCVEYPGAISQGKTIDECISNIKEALDLILEDEKKASKDSKLVFEVPAALA
ncbi:MAG: type II toxin-antitoxin system HicB family antitoxin [Candidatus Altiarchaeota archaeon]|nr:type II toxin-antitoxin system HicB family antitoxin [Candidatus Altiarchaeota archaeon]